MRGRGSCLLRESRSARSEWEGSKSWWGELNAYLRGKCVVGETMKVRVPGVQEREGFLLLLESLVQHIFNSE